MTRRQDVLNEANRLIHGPRQAHYGTPSVNFRRFADRIEQHIGQDVPTWQSAVIMADLKLARLAQGYHEDSIVDAIGYLALAAELYSEERDEPDRPDTSG